MIGTRPDCMPDSLLDYLEEVNRRTFLLVEYGIESADDRTLERINRGHSFACTEDAVRRTAARGIRTGGHVSPGITGREPGRSHKAGGTSVGTAAHNAEDAPASAHSRNAHGA